MAVKPRSKKNPRADTKASLNIKLIGTGGVGECLILPLCRYLNHESRAYPDVAITLTRDTKTIGHVNKKHRDRQACDEVWPKASMTAADLKGQFPRIKFFDHLVFVDDQNAGQLIQEGDVILLCVDNHKSRKVVSDRAVQLMNVTIISGGCDWADGNVLLHIRRDGENLTPPLASQYHPEILHPTDKHPCEVEKRQRRLGTPAPSPQLVVTTNLVAATMLCVFFSIVDGRQNKQVLAAPENYAELYCDLATLTTKRRSRKP